MEYNYHIKKCVLSQSGISLKSLCEGMMIYSGLCIHKNVNMLILNIYLRLALSQTVGLQRI